LASTALIHLVYTDEVLLGVHDELENPSNGQPLRAAVKKIFI